MKLEEIADLWLASHNPLGRQRMTAASSLRRFPELERYPDAVVRRAIETTNRPEDVLWATRELHAVIDAGGTSAATPARRIHSDIKAGRRASPNPFCDHAVPKAKCVVCSPRLTGILYITGGGTHIHRRPTCLSLAKGQEQVRRRGGSPEEIEPVNTYDGRLRDRDWCKTCGGYAGNRDRRW